jgi:hypothetical protein
MFPGPQLDGRPSWATLSEVIGRLPQIAPKKHTFLITRSHDLVTSSGCFLSGIANTILPRLSIEMNKVADISGMRVRRGRALSHWKEVLTAWIATHEAFCKHVEGDAGYWYTERANTGLLAHAAWKAGYFALEEYQKSKRNISDKRKKSKGRADLWISGADFSESMEAKQKYFHLGHSRNASTLDSHLDIARKDSLRARAAWDAYHSGILFAVPYMPVKKAVDLLIEDAIKASVNAALALDTDFVGWTFPSTTRALKNMKGNHYYPGVVILGRRISDAS